MKKNLFAVFVILFLFGGLCIFIYALTNNKIVIGYNKGYMPDQPIPFSHETSCG